MTKRKGLAVAVGALCLVGAALAAVPFFASLAPTERAKASLPRIGVEDVPVGFSRTVDWRGLKVYIYRTSAETMFVYAVPFKDGTYRLPDIHWSRPSIACHNFRTPFDSSGKINMAGEFACKDPELGEWWLSELRWSVEGKRLGKAVEDMWSLPHLVEQGYVVLGAR